MNAFFRSHRDHIFYSCIYVLAFSAFALFAWSVISYAIRPIEPLTSCVSGVEYVLFPSGSTVAYTPDGKIKTCIK